MNDLLRDAPLFHLDMPNVLADDYSSTIAAGYPGSSEAASRQKK